MKKIYYDTETTGLAPGNIAQLSIIVEHKDGRLETKNYFFDIDYISEGAQKACGRGLEFYKPASKGLRFKDYKDEILDIFKDAMLIAHNEKFDENFICTEFWRLGISYTPKAKFCTMEYFKDIIRIPGKGRYKYKNPSLSELVDYFNIDKNKVKAYSDKLFDTDENSEYGFQDARYDTTAKYVAFQIYREQINNEEDGNWKKAFTIE